jgi:hypothetical protein
MDFPSKVKPFGLGEEGLEVELEGEVENERFRRPRVRPRSQTNGRDSGKRQESNDPSNSGPQILHCKISLFYKIPCIRLLRI